METSDFNLRHFDKAKDELNNLFYLLYPIYVDLKR
jgi:hypothetical protein